jgi:hypothetical protein
MIRKYSKIGGYPIFYLNCDDLVMCVDCVIEESAYFEEYVDVEEAFTAKINWEKERHCEWCNSKIEKAYDDQNEGEENGQ